MSFLKAYSEGEVQFLTHIVKRASVRWTEWALTTASRTFRRWVETTVLLRGEENESKEQDTVKRILRESERGNRTQQERDTLRKYCSKLRVLSKDLNKEQMDTLCNEVDYYPVEGKSIVFLQGDFGNVYYIIACGEVALYMEASKDREMEMGREFGHHRGQPFQFEIEKSLSIKGEGLRASVVGGDAAGAGSRRKSEGAGGVMSYFDPSFIELKRQEELARLGMHVVTLKAGLGFGEAAILSAKSKLRGATAFSFTDDTFLLILHADTYNAVLKQAHYRQKQLASCTALLNQLPLFRHYPYPQLQLIAYYMSSKQFSLGAVIRKAGAPVDCVLIVCNGTVRQSQPPPKGRLPDNATQVEKLVRRLPSFSYSVLGRGCVIGEREVHECQEFLQRTYMANSNDCEVFEMPMNVWVEYAATKEMRKTGLFKEVQGLRGQVEEEHTERLRRAVDTVKSLVVSEAAFEDDKAALLQMLPLLVDGIDADNTAAWGGSLQQRNARPQGFKYERETAMGLLKVPESPSSPPPSLPIPPQQQGVMKAGRPSPKQAAQQGAGAARGKAIHFGSRLVQESSSFDPASTSNQPTRPGPLPGRSATLRSPRISLASASSGAVEGSEQTTSRYYANKKHHKPKSEVVASMKFF